MKIATKAALSLIVVSGLSACSNAKSADEVSAAFVPTGHYNRMSCSDLRSEERAAQFALDEHEAAITKSYNEDKAAEAIAWFLFAPALLVMDGNSEDQKAFGEAKGKLLAIQDAMDNKRC